MKIHPKGKAIRLSKNFKSTEFDCHGKGCCTETPIDDELIEILQELRNHFGKPVKVNSGYRCPVHNGNVGGASKTSYHMKGMAADIKINGVHPMRIARYLDNLNVSGRIGCYSYDDEGKGFVHIDTRGKKSRAVYTENNTEYDTVPNFRSLIRRGDRGRIVIVVQRRLKKLGYYHAKIDGKCGPGTEQAIVLYNASQGRLNDGVWGPKCWEETFAIQ